MPSLFRSSSAKIFMRSFLRIVLWKMVKVKIKRSAASQLHSYFHLASALQICHGDTLASYESLFHFSECSLFSKERCHTYMT